MFGFLTGTAFCVDIPVPTKEEMLQKADTIIVCKLASKEGGFEAVISKVLKGDSKLSEKPVRVRSPYPPMSFPLANWVQSDRDKSIILLGKWNEEDRTLVLSYGGASYWPRGLPDDVSKVKTLEAGTRVIHEFLASQAPSK